MSTFALWRLFHRPGSRGSAGHTSMLAIIAFAAATTIFLTVLGGVHGFIWRASADHTVACAFDLGACRPTRWPRGNGRSATRRTWPNSPPPTWCWRCSPACCSSCRSWRSPVPPHDWPHPAATPVSPPCSLAGATTGQVVRLTALDAAGQALIGALIGIAGYCALMPAVMLIPSRSSGSPSNSCGWDRWLW